VGSDALRRAAIEGCALKVVPKTVDVPESPLTRAFLKLNRLGAEVALIIIPMVSRKISFVRATTAGGNESKVCPTANWAKLTSADFAILLRIICSLLPISPQFGG
jgi:hypothetical protein